MKPRTSFVSALVLSASCAATGIGPPSGGAEGKTQPHEREIDRSEFRLRWPFDVGAATLACESGAVVVRIADVTYGLNEPAIARGFTPPTPILREQRVQPKNPLSRIPQDDRERIFSGALQCDRAGESDPCRFRLRGQYRLTEAEFDQMVVEGRERHWPPLEPKRMSVEPIVEAGLKLCGP